MTLTVVTVSWTVNSGEVVLEMSDMRSIVTTLQNLNTNGVSFRTSFKEVEIDDE